MLMKKEAKQRARSRRITVRIFTRRNEYGAGRQNKCASSTICADTQPTGAQTGNTSEFIENAFAPECGFPMHIHHNEDEATMSLRGSSSSSLVTPA
jgi:hypothetical protein